MTISDCRSGNRTKLEWSQFGNVSVASINESRVISQLQLPSEKFCIVAYHTDTSCVAVQVNSTADGDVICKFLSYTPSVKNQTGVKLLLKGKKVCII